MSESSISSSRINNSDLGLAAEDYAAAYPCVLEDRAAAISLYLRVRGGTTQAAEDARVLVRRRHLPEAHRRRADAELPPCELDNDALHSQPRDAGVRRSMRVAQLRYVGCVLKRNAQRCFRQRCFRSGARLWRRVLLRICEAYRWRRTMCHCSSFARAVYGTLPQNVDDPLRY